MKMKNKQEAQKTQKELHRQRQQETKARRRGGSSFARVVETKVEKPVILIVCEGKRTEKEYFDHFRLSSATIRAIGEGYNTVSLVRRAQELAKSGTYEQVWCVFDKDSFTVEAFNEAIQLAERLKYKVAYSNQAFEYWLILHFEDHQGGGMDRGLYGDKLNSYLDPLGEHYEAESGKGISLNIFTILQAIDPQKNKRRVDLAIRRARKIWKEHENNGTPPALAESSTTVYKLVEEILKYT